MYTLYGAGANVQQKLPSYLICLFPVFVLQVFPEILGIMHPPTELLIIGIRILIILGVINLFPSFFFLSLPLLVLFSAIEI
jgi:hypothetical protein